MELKRSKRLKNPTQIYSPLPVHRHPSADHHSKPAKPFRGRPVDKAGWQQRWTEEETRAILTSLVAFNQRHPNSTALQVPISTNTP